MLGAVDLRSEDGNEVGSVLAQPKRVALLAYLAVNSARGYVRRDTLLGVFWPELDEAHARGALNTAVYQLRRSLGNNVIVSRGEELTLNEQAITADSAAFERAVKAGDHASAVELYRGELLEGWFVDDSPAFDMWLSLERLRLNALAAKCAVAPLQPAAPSSVESVATIAAPPRRARRTRALQLGGLALMIILIPASLVVALRQDARLQRVLVAPFDNRTGRVDFDAIGAVAADWVAQGIAQAEVADVTDRMAVAGLITRNPGGQALDWLALARKLDARLLLSGSYYSNAGRLQLHATLYDAVTGTAITVFDPITIMPESALTAIHGLRDRAVSAVAVALQVRLPGDWSVRTSDPPRYDAYLEYLAGGDALTRRDFEAALPRFLRAGEFDSTFTQAALHAGFVSALTGNAHMADSLLRIVERRQDRLTAVENTFYDYILAFRAGDHEGQVRAATELARRAPDSEWPGNLAMRALNAGRPREAAKMFAAMDPTSPALDGFFLYWVSYGMALHATGDYRAELKTVERGLEQYPGNTAIFAARMRALAARGRVADLLEGLVSMPVPESGHGTWTRGTVYATAIAELDAHGHTRAAAQARSLFRHWYRSLPAEQRLKEPPAFGLTWVMYFAQAWPDLQEHTRELLRFQPQHPNWLMFAGLAAAQRGDTATARMIERWFANRSDAELRREGFTYNRLHWHTQMVALQGDADSAMALLREGNASAWAYSVYHHADPAFTRMRALPAFMDLVNPGN
jgi:tetratricopeptide (TPR) repeat protein